jgi:SAM-dependent methyltransferase
MRPAEFEKLYAGSTDPWGYRSRWYEERKRALLLACLPRAHFATGCELGCSNGELTAALAERCDSLIATDGNNSAVALARERTSSCGNVTVERHWHPQTWPRGKFELIVISEIGYYLPETGVTNVAAFCRRSLAIGGVVVACHWRYPIEGCVWTGDGVHSGLQRMLPWQRIVSHVEADFILEIWSADPRSVAQREGLAASDGGPAPEISENDAR